MNLKLRLFFINFVIKSLNKYKMKKLLIGAIVGGVLLFFWQFLSWSILGVHESMQTYTPKQTEVIKYLNENLDEGFYYLPNLPKGYSNEDMEKLSTETMGKPWAQVYMHKAMTMSMPANIGRGLLVTLLAVFLLTWVLIKIGKTSFMEILLCSLAIGLSSYLTTSYAVSIWYQTLSMPDLIDAIVGWGLVGAWLGWWLNRD
jgi:hypothetical protein